MGHSQHDLAGRSRPAWNAGKRVGVKRPLKVRQIWEIRFFLDREGRSRDRAPPVRYPLEIVPSKHDVQLRLPVTITIDEGVPVPSDDFPEGILADEIMARLRDWLLALPDSSFQLDDLGVKVSRKTPPGTRILDGRLYGDLRNFTEDYERIRKTRKASEK